jgi:23S rRNA pseudouridine1911/1915/1917 synthase
MKPEERTLTVDLDHAGNRLDQFLAALVSEISRARVQALIRSGNVKVDGHSAKPSHKVREGESIWVRIEAAEKSSFEPEDIPLNIVFEDEHIILVDKPAGMVVHPAAGVNSGTLVNALLAHSSELPTAGGIDRPGIVHRLDKNTSGLLVVAKTESAHRSLSDCIARREIKRKYRALAYGRFAESSGTIDAPIGRSPSDRKKMAVTGIGSREAKTHFTVRESFKGISHLTVELSTGRTHQIRVHMAYIGHPIVGDSIYGTRLKRFYDKISPDALETISGLKGHMLHSEILEFEHPETGEHVRFEAQLPQEFANLLELLQKSS